MGSPLTQALADKDFLAAPAAQQKGYLASIDPDFAKASSSDQDAYLNHIVPAKVNVGGSSVDLRTGEGGGEAAAAQAKTAGQAPLARARLATQPRGLYTDAGGAPLTPEQQRRSNIVGYSTLGALAGPLALPEVAGLAGVAAGSGMAGLGAGAGTMAGQKASGENPLTLPNLREAGENAAITGATGLVLGTVGAAGKALGLGNLKALGGPGLRAAMYTPEGEFNPTLEEAVSHPLKNLGKGALKAIIPPPKPGGLGASLPSASEFYENRGADLMRRGTQQAALDRQAAVAARRALAGSPTPFGQGMTSTAEPIGNAQLPKISTLGAPAENPKVTYVSKFANGPGPSPTPFGQGMTSTAEPIGNAQLPKISTLGAPAENPKVTYVSKFANGPGPKSLIVDPNSAPPEVKTTYQSYPRQTLVKLALKGDTDAIAELRRNPAGVDLDSIPNLRYMMEQGADTKPWRAYRR